MADNRRVSVDRMADAIMDGLMEYAYLSYQENVRLNSHDLTKSEFVSAIVEGGLKDEL